MYAKLQNGLIELAPKMMEQDGIVYYNPSAEMLIRGGYKPVLETPYPVQEEEENANEYESHYEAQGEVIVQVWEKVARTAAEEVRPKTIEDRIREIEFELSELKKLQNKEEDNI